MWGNKLKIAIPVFHTKISPRFDQTQAFVLLETENESVVARANLTTKGWSANEKMKKLVNLGVDTLICGGIDRASLQYLNFNGVNIYSWVTGEVDDAVACFLDNRMKPGIILGDQGEMKGHWQFCKGRNHVCNMFQAGFYQGEKGVKKMPKGDGTGPRGHGPQSGTRGGGCKPKKGGRGSGQGRGPRSDRGKGSGKQIRRNGEAE